MKRTRTARPQVTSTQHQSVLLYPYLSTCKFVSPRTTISHQRYLCFVFVRLMLSRSAQTTAGLWDAGQRCGNDLVGNGRRRVVPLIAEGSLAAHKATGTHPSSQAAATRWGGGGGGLEVRHMSGGRPPGLDKLGSWMMVGRTWRG